MTHRSKTTTTKNPLHRSITMADTQFQKTNGGDHPEVTLPQVLNRLIESTFYPDQDSKFNSIRRRFKDSVSENHQLFREGLKNTSRDVVLWTRRGGPLRSLLVVSVGTITLLALTGMLIFMLFFIVATANAIVISLLVSLAAAGGFLALFFVCVTAIYIGALSIAIFVSLTITGSAIIAALIVTGWIGLFWILWLATSKVATVAKYSLNLTGSSVSSYSARHANHTRDEGTFSECNGTEDN